MIRYHQLGPGQVGPADKVPGQLGPGTKWVQGA